MTILSSNRCVFFSRSSSINDRSSRTIRSLDDSTAYTSIQVFHSLSDGDIRDSMTIRNVNNAICTCLCNGAM
ncbi:hypothetical protein QYF36_024842 [Acer negundo]|nr:hypothetical protein QYF36_024842 [Acer negundo]